MQTPDANLTNLVLESDFIDFWPISYWMIAITLIQFAGNFSLVRSFPSSSLGTQVQKALASCLLPREAGASRTAFPSWSLGTS